MLRGLKAVRFVLARSLSAVNRAIGFLEESRGRKEALSKPLTRGQLEFIQAALIRSENSIPKGEEDMRRSLWREARRRGPDGDFPRGVLSYREHRDMTVELAPHFAARAWAWFKESWEQGR